MESIRLSIRIWIFLAEIIKKTLKLNVTLGSFCAYNLQSNETTCQTENTNKPHISAMLRFSYILFARSNGMKFNTCFQFQCVSSSRLRFIFKTSFLSRHNLLLWSYLSHFFVAYMNIYFRQTHELTWLKILMNVSTNDHLKSIFQITTPVK